MAKAQIEIGKRAVEEIMRMFPTHQAAKNALGIKSRQLIYDWMDGVAPGAKYLQRLYYCGADIIYILTGTRSE